MARPVKAGLDYFPFDCNFFAQRSVRALSGRFGAAGVAVYIYIMSEMYGNAGYYTTIDADFFDVCACDLRVDVDELEKIVAFLVDRSLLVRMDVADLQIYTSAEVQRRYQLAKKSGNRKTEVDGDIWLLNAAETMPHIVVKRSKDLMRQCSSTNHDMDNYNTENGFSVTNEGFSVTNEGFSGVCPDFIPKGKESKEKESKGEVKERETGSEKTKITTAATQKILAALESGGLFPTAVVKSTVEKWLLQSSVELLVDAVEEAEKCGKINIRYIEAILARYRRDGLKTVSDVERHEKSRQSGSKRFRDRNTSVYKQGTTDYSQLEKLMNEKY